jgi:hypothetical protein
MLPGDGVFVNVLSGEKAGKRRLVYRCARSKAKRHGESAMDTDMALGPDVTVQGLNAIGLRKIIVLRFRMIGPDVQ